MTGREVVQWAIQGGRFTGPEAANPSDPLTDNDRALLDPQLDSFGLRPWTYEELAMGGRVLTWDECAELHYQKGLREGRPVCERRFPRDCKCDPCRILHNELRGPDLDPKSVY